MRIETEGLTVPVVMSSKSGLHVLECGGIIHGSGTVSIIPRNQEFRHQPTVWQPLENSQPRVHQMGTTNTPVIEEGIHRNLPEPRKFGLTLANTGDRQTIVGEAIVQSIRPESVGIWLGNGDGGRCRRVVGKLSLI